MRVVTVNWLVIGYQARGFVETPRDCATNGNGSPRVFRTRAMAEAAREAKQKESALDWDVVRANEIDIPQLLIDCGLED